jgi:hypothetical protein
MKKTRKYSFAMFGAIVTGNVPERKISNYLQNIMIDLFTDVEKWDLCVERVSIYKYKEKYVIKAWPNRHFIPFGSYLDSRHTYIGDKTTLEGQRCSKAEININDTVIAEVMLS